MVVVHPVEHDLRSPIPASCYIASHLILRRPEHLFHHLRCNVEDGDGRGKEEGDDDHDIVTDLTSAST